MAWHEKFSTITTGPAAYLLQIPDLHQRHYCQKPETHIIQVSRNLKANDCSCKCNLTDDELLAYFILKYSLPISWKLFHLRPNINSALTLALLRRRSLPESYLPAIKSQKSLGTSGASFLNQLMKTHTFQLWQILSHYSSVIANQACLVEDAIWLFSQKFPSLGAQDPHLYNTGFQDFCLRQIYSAWKK